MATMTFLANFDGSLSAQDTTGAITLDSTGTITYASGYFAGKQGALTSAGNYASDADIENANKLSEAAGAMAVRFRRDADLGAFEQLVSLGTSGNATSHFIGLGISDIDQLYVSHRNGGAAATVLVIATPTVSTATHHFAYADWNGTAYSLAFNDTTTSGTRNTPTQDLVPGALGIGAYAAGATNTFQGLIDAVAFWDAPLTPTERTSLQARTTPWTWQMSLSAATGGATPIVAIGAPHVGPLIIGKD